MSADSQPRIITQQPPITFLRLPDVEQRVKLKRSAIYQRMSEGRFPKSRSLGARCTVWIESEIEDWMRQHAFQ
ncbi:MAG: AlpA family phage regulatory protein [Sphingomonadales bacterium]|nr:AlpA family phage regulatory protein [Sphingomonadaceae bacterium]MBS3932549.1 AlpA family phage regulatory protein [Sphingomonadales bacterium]